MKNVEMEMGFTELIQYSESTAIQNLMEYSDTNRRNTISAKTYRL
jgi:hypothetical protein